jgi:hypothetical protein
LEDAVDGIALERVNWVLQPSLYILIHEPPAKRYSFGVDDWFVHWHYAKGPTDVPRSRLETDPQKFISTVLFVDAHAAKHDFTMVMKSQPDFPYEPTKDWVWYKPKPERVENP